jgi:precorrin-2 dehydrogenase/sirohydrochlorin ferrochelatase
MSGRYLISLDLTSKKCLVVGGGNVAERKVLSLLECGALVYVVSPDLTPVLKSLFEESLIQYRQGKYQSSDLADKFLVIGAAGTETVNRQVADDCAQRSLIVNIVDDPTKGSFFVPASLKRGSLTIAVSTGGKSPLLARKIKEELENAYGTHYEEFLDLLGYLREDVIKNVADPEKKKKILENLVNDDVLNMLKEGRIDSAKEMLLGVNRGSGA